jgi:hypothetical protein
VDVFNFHSCFVDKDADCESQTTGESSANGIVVITMRELRQSLKNRSTIPPSEVLLVRPQ